MNPMSGKKPDDSSQDEGTEDDGENMDELLNQIQRDHPEKFAKLQRLQSQMNDLDL